ncbi:MAG: phenylacetate-CoA oxygenase/reductase subunit PaaK [Burkholderiales bacterium]|nr:phenylacetate-CoA oxygenase/reductase subunit PaaK [Burkholderiales bacterium]
MSRFYPLTIDAVRRETRDAIAVTFRVPPELAATFRYREGQHITLRTRIDGEDVRRSYSVCSAVQDARLRIAIKRVPGGRFSNWANDHLAAGQTLEVMPPVGHFNVPLAPGNRKHYVAFAAGSGITPVLSVVKTVLAAEPASEFTLFYGNRASGSVMFKEELEDLKDACLARFNLVFVLSREQQDIELFNGRFTREKCGELLRRWVDLAEVDTVFVCGPAGMMEEVQAALAAAGFDKSRVKVEIFATSLPRKGAAPHAHPVVGANQCEVTVVQDGRRRTFAMEKNAAAILDAALAQGIELPYACKGGICATCRAKLLEGEVDMDANFALEDYEVARGFVLTCQSYPVTDRVTVDFDQDA